MHDGDWLAALGTSSVVRAANPVPTPTRHLATLGGRGSHSLHAHDPVVDFVATLGVLLGSLLPEQQGR